MRGLPLLPLLLVACSGGGAADAGLSAAAIDDYYQDCASSPCQAELRCRPLFGHQYCTTACTVNADCGQLGHLTRCLEGSCVTACNSMITTECPARAQCDIGFEVCVPR